MYIDKLVQDKLNYYNLENGFIISWFFLKTKATKEMLYLDEKCVY